MTPEEAEAYLNKLWEHLSRCKTQYQEGAINSVEFLFQFVTLQEFLMNRVATDMQHLYHRISTLEDEARMKEENEQQSH